MREVVEQVVRVAESATVVEKAVSDFEAEVRGMRDRLYTAFMEKSGRASDNMARRVCEEFWGGGQAQMKPGAKYVWVVGGGGVRP